MRRLPQTLRIYSQRGAALIISMVMLLAITAIGITVMGGSHLEWLMASNSYFQSNAYMNAETELEKGLATLPTSITTPMPTSYPTLTADPSDIKNWNNGAIAYTASGTNGYVVEYRGCSAYTLGGNGAQFYQAGCTNPPPPPPYAFAYTYRVWAMGQDAKGSARILKATHIVTNLTSQTAYDTQAEIQ